MHIKTKFEESEYYKVFRLLFHEGNESKVYVLADDDPIIKTFKNFDKTIHEMIVNGTASTCYRIRGDFNSGDGYCLTKAGLKIFKSLFS